MQKEDAISSLGAIGSSVAAFLGYLWNIGFLQLIFSFMAGSFSTYFIQRKLQVESEKRARAREHAILMRDEVYGPLFRAFDAILSGLENFADTRGSYPYNPVSETQSVVHGYLFLLTEKGLQDKVLMIDQHLSNYSDELYRAKLAVIDIGNQIFERAHPDFIKTFDSNSVRFILEDHGTGLAQINLVEAVLRRTNPIETFQKSMSELEKPTIKVITSDKRYEDLGKLSKLFAEIESLAWKEKRLIEHEETRQCLIRALKETIPELKKKIVA